MNELVAYEISVHYPATGEDDDFRFAAPSLSDIVAYIEQTSAPGTVVTNATLIGDIEVLLLADADDDCDCSSAGVVEDDEATASEASQEAGP